MRFLHVISYNLEITHWHLSNTNLLILSTEPVIQVKGRSTTSCVRIQVFMELN